MKIVIIGGGLAGTIAAKTSRELDGNVQITVFDEEKYEYYPRPNLIEFMEGSLPYEKLFTFTGGWAERQRITVNRGTVVSGIAPAEKSIKLADGQPVPYDVLLLATGARSFVPGIQGRDLKGVFVLRTLDDALAILDYLPSAESVTVLGGGLLGLEIARALSARGGRVTVIEFFDRLLPRQLDNRGSLMLEKRIESLGITVKLGTKTETILGESSASGLRFEHGQELKTGMIIIAAGVVPETGLASGAGIEVKKGILVDDLLRTNVPDIFAAGDCTEHRGRVYGIIPASFEQSRAAAYNMLKIEKPYSGTVPSNTLKVAGTYVTSAGLFDTEEPGYEILVNESEEKSTYRKLVLKAGRLAGAIWMGDRKSSLEITRLVMNKADVGNWKKELLEEDFDFSVLQ